MRFDIPSDDVKLLAEIGFMGLGRGLAAEASAVFAGLRALRPESEAGYVGGALAALAAGQGDAAAALLRASPQTEAVVGFRAMVSERLGDAKMVAELVADLGFMRAAPAVMDIATGAGPKA